MPEKDPKAVAFGNRLRELRESSGQSREQLASVAGVSSRAIVQWELGEREPGWFNIQSLAAALGVTCEAFGEPAQERQPPGRGRPRKTEAPTEAPKEPEVPARSSGKKPKAPTTGKPRARKKKAD